jgi:thiol-disulfide isomerase/thioredoxin
VSRALPALLLTLAAALPALAGGEDSGLIPKAERKDASAFGFSDGKKKGTLADYRGKVVVVDFWTTWCPPCRKSLPELAHLQKQEAKAPIAIIPVNQDEEGWTIVTPFLAKNAKVLEGFRVFMAGTGKNGIGVLGEVNAYPTTYLIDAEGKVAWRWTGYGEGMLVERLKRLLKELPPPTPAS